MEYSGLDIGLFDLQVEPTYKSQNAPIFDLTNLQRLICQLMTFSIYNDTDKSYTAEALRVYRPEYIAEQCVTYWTIASTLYEAELLINRAIDAEILVLQDSLPSDPLYALNLNSPDVRLTLKIDPEHYEMFIRKFDSTERTTRLPEISFHLAISSFMRAWGLNDMSYNTFFIASMIRARVVALTVRYDTSRKFGHSRLVSLNRMHDDVRKILGFA